MRWEDEQFVKVYTRDTGEWLALGWEAQALFLFLLRKADRAGLIHAGRAKARGLAGMTGMPLDVVERALPPLLDDGCLRECEGGYVIPRFVVAQEARQTDRARKAAQRERDRDKSIHSGQGVTARDALAQIERSESHPVTLGHTTSHGVTLRRDETRAEETRREDPPNPPKGEVVGEAGQIADEIASVLREQDPSWQWTAAKEAHLRPLLSLPGATCGEIIRRLCIALRTPFPRFVGLQSLGKNWDAYAAMPPTAGAPPDKQSGLGLRTGGRSASACSKCGESAEAVFGEQRLCYPDMAEAQRLSEERGLWGGPSPDWPRLNAFIAKWVTEPEEARHVG